MNFHDFCPPYENPWFHLENFTIAQPLGAQPLINHDTIGERQCFDQFRRNYAIDSLNIFGDLR